jgi:membrane protein implicated in regulation of membrane protease activity
MTFKKLVVRMALTIMLVALAALLLMTLVQMMLWGFYIYLPLVAFVGIPALAGGMCLVVFLAYFVWKAIQGRRQSPSITKLSPYREIVGDHEFIEIEPGVKVLMPVTTS